VAERIAKDISYRARLRFDDLKYRATAVIDRVRLWWTLPAAPANGYVRSSEYVTVRDGTMIAVDVYRPSRNGVPLDGPLPVVWSFERYHRARAEREKLRTRLDGELWLDPLCRRGYVIAVADLRGSGASFGSRPTLVTEHDRWDAYDLTEWLAAQPWSNGRVGMFGKSFMGMTQYLAASASPPHLVAIVPEKTLFDLYSFAYSGGVFRDDYARAWGANVAELDHRMTPATVDADIDGRLRARAVAEHRDNLDVREFSRLPCRDSRNDDDTRPYLDQSPDRGRGEISASGVAILQIAGWYDMWPRDALQWHRNLSNPRRLLLGPWPHTGDSGWKTFVQRLRWFDYWLKGVENDVMNEPAIRYYTAGAGRHDAWRSAEQWPLPSAVPTAFYFGPAAAEPATSGALSTAIPATDADADSYVVDYAATSGDGTRWKNGYGQPFGYQDMAVNDARALTYTTPALQADLEVTGHPIVTLWLTATAPDVDIFVYLEDVRRNEYSEYVTEGVLRASHRAESEPPYHNLGLPYHASLSDTVACLPVGEPVRLTFDLHPVSRIFRRGHRIRVAITGADADNARTPVLDPAPTITVRRNSRHPSCIVLPLIPRGARG
jgi:putative CocE/NonD family hydrolase